MIKVIILELESNDTVLTEMPKIPKEGDQICCFFSGRFSICDITSIRYYFFVNGDFERIEIGVTRI